MEDCMNFTLHELYILPLPPSLPPSHRKRLLSCMPLKLPPYGRPYLLVFVFPWWSMIIFPPLSILLFLESRFTVRIVLIKTITLTPPHRLCYARLLIITLHNMLPNPKILIMCFSLLHLLFACERLLAWSEHLYSNWVFVRLHLGHSGN